MSAVKRTPTVDELAAVIGKVKWMRPDQARWITEQILRRCCPTIIEIGTFHGAGTCYLAAAAAVVGGHVHTIDLPSSINNRPNVEQLLQKCQLAEFATVWRDPRGSSILDDWPDQSADVVYVDGNHTRLFVEKDIANAVRLLRPGGLLLLDDLNHKYYSADVTEAWRSALRKYPLRPLKHVPIKQWAAAEKV